MLKQIFSIFNLFLNRLKDRFLIRDFSRARTCGINLEIAESQSFSQRARRGIAASRAIAPVSLSSSSPPFLYASFFRTYRSHLSHSRVFTPRQSCSCFRSSHPLCERGKNRGLHPELLHRPLSLSLLPSLSLSLSLFFSRKTLRTRHTDLLNWFKK